ncbi:redoxin domain-containing protein [bacterium]|nr:redoxin domain-containing protein [bacterium]
MANKQFYDFHAKTLQGQETDMAQYQGKVVLVVNTASKCGFTPQYAGLEELYKKHHDEGLVILGFPCNQFGGQEPGDAEEIQSGCLINYGVSFPMFEKIDVNGSSAHPLFQWLKEKLPGLMTNAVKWNFTKFLIGRDGKPIKRYAPQTEPESIEPAIEEALGQGN